MKKRIVNSKIFFHEYHTANSNDDENMITQNISPGVCCFWFYCGKIDPMIKLQKLTKNMGLKKVNGLVLKS